MPVIMLLYGADHSPSLYATTVHKNVTAEELASSSSHSFPKYCVIFLIFISQEKFEAFLLKCHMICKYRDVDVWLHFYQL